MADFSSIKIPAILALAGMMDAQTQTPAVPAPTQQSAEEERLAKQSALETKYAAALNSN